MDQQFKNSIENYSYAKEVMPLWIDGAKTFAATASAALGLTIVFKEKVLGNSGRMRTSRFLLASWLTYLLCIGSSILYQWMAAHWILRLLANPKTDQEPLPYYPFSWLSPHFVYGVMMVCFYAASFFLVIASAQELERKDKEPQIEVEVQKANVVVVSPPGDTTTPA